MGKELANELGLESRYGQIGLVWRKGHSVGKVIVSRTLSDEVLASAIAGGQCVFACSAHPTSNLIMSQQLPSSQALSLAEQRSGGLDRLAQGPFCPLPPYVGSNLHSSH